MLPQQEPKSLEWKAKAHPCLGFSKAFGSTHPRAKRPENRLDCSSTLWLQVLERNGTGFALCHQILKCLYSITVCMFIYRNELVCTLAADGEGSRQMPRACRADFGKYYLCTVSQSFLVVNTTYNRRCFRKGQIHIPHGFLCLTCTHAHTQCVQLNKQNAQN